MPIPERYRKTGGEGVVKKTEGEARTLRNIRRRFLRQELDVEGSVDAWTEQKDGDKYQVQYGIGAGVTTRLRRGEGATKNMQAFLGQSWTLYS